MADQLVPGFNPASLMSGFDAFTTIIFWIIICIAIGGIVFFIWWYLSFKYNVVVRDVINEKTIIKTDKAKIVKTKAGVQFWKLRGYGVRVPEPPSKSIDVDFKGKKWVEFYKLPDGSFVPITDDFNHEKFLKEHPSFKPFTTEQRALLVHELEEAEKYKKKRLSEILMALAPYIAILLILTIFMIFFNDVVAPTVALGTQLTAATEKLSNSLDTLNGMIGNTSKVNVEYRPSAPGTR